MIRLLLSALILVVALTSAKANDLLIFYSNNESSQYSNLKSHYEGLGFTVTGSTSGTVSSSLLSGKEMVIDMASTSNCGSTCRTNYDSFVSGGGKLLIAGTNGATNRNSSIEALIESKMSVGSFTQGGSSNGGYQNIARGNYASSTSSENILPGTDKFMYNVSGGEMVSANSATSTYEMWHKWDYGSNGGAVYVTFGYGQFLSTHTYSSNMETFLTTVVEEEGLYSSSAPQAGITTSQQTTVNTTRNKTQAGNKIYMTQSGSGIDLDILQDGDDNLIIGTDLTSSGSIQGDYNEITLTQKNNDNVLGIDVNGNSNDVDVWQDTGQRAIVEITGNSNTLDLEQLHLSNSGEHFARVEVNGNSNSLTIDQKETGDKILFLDVDNSNNVQVDQKGTGDHYINIILTDSHTLDITQDGSGSHDAHINLSGNNTSITLTQDSSTDQNYYLEQNCVSASCSATVTQN